MDQLALMLFVLLLPQFLHYSVEFALDVREGVKKDDDR